MKKRTHGWFARIMIQLFGMNPPVKNSDSNAGAGGGTPPVVVNNPQPSPAPYNSTPPAAADSRDAIDISKARTISKYVKNVPAMPIVTHLYDINTGHDRVTFNYDKVDWKSDGTIDGRIAVIWYEGEQLIIGEFDGKRPNQKMKGLENIHGGYIQGKQPKAGQEVWFVIYDKLGRERSNVASGGLWK